MFLELSGDHFSGGYPIVGSKHSSWHLIGAELRGPISCYWAPSPNSTQGMQNIQGRDNSASTGRYAVQAHRRFATSCPTQELKNFYTSFQPACARFLQTDAYEWHAERGAWCKISQIQVAQSLIRQPRFRHEHFNSQIILGDERVRRRTSRN
jgi:hypothetical protein